MYRLRVITDCEKTENTFVYLDGVRQQHLTKFAIDISTKEVFVPVKTKYIPLPLTEVIFEDEDFEAQEKIKKFKNKLEIFTDGKTHNTHCFLDGNELENLQRLKLYATSNNAKIELELEYNL